MEISVDTGVSPTIDYHDRIARFNDKIKEILKDLAVLLGGDRLQSVFTRYRDREIICLEWDSGSTCNFAQLSYAELLNMMGGYENIISKIKPLYKDFQVARRASSEKDKSKIVKSLPNLTRIRQIVIAISHLNQDESIQPHDMVTFTVGHDSSHCDQFVVSIPLEKLIT